MKLEISYNRSLLSYTGLQRGTGMSSLNPMFESVSFSLAQERPTAMLSATRTRRHRSIIEPEVVSRFPGKSLVVEFSAIFCRFAVHHEVGNLRLAKASSATIYDWND